MSARSAPRLAMVTSVMLAAALVGACAGDDAEETTPATAKTTGGTAGQNVNASSVSVKTFEYRFEEPAQFTGGLVTLELDNSQGREEHEAALVRLEQGKTVDDLEQALRQEGGPPPRWIVNAGGPGPVLPGRKATYTANVQRGTYAFICLVHSADGQSHAAKGMLASVTVVDGPTGMLPKADTTVTARDYEFVGVERLSSGAQTVRVHNQGALEHNWGIFGLRPGKTAQDLATFLAAEGPPSGPPPFTGTPGLVGVLPPGGEATRTLELQPGTYALVCFVRDPDGRAHFQKGMVREFTIG